MENLTLNLAILFETQPCPNGLEVTKSAKKELLKF